MKDRPNMGFPIFEFTKGTRGVLVSFISCVLQLNVPFLACSLKNICQSYLLTGCPILKSNRHLGS